MIFPTLIFSTVTLAAATFGPIRWYWQPYRQYQRKVRSTMAWRQTENQRIKDEEAAKILDERRKKLVGVAKQQKRNFIEAFTQLGFYYRYKTAESRERARAQVQRMEIPDAIIGVDFLVFPLKLPLGVKPSSLLDPDTQDNMRLLTRRPDMQILRTDYDGLFAFVPLRGAKDGIPDLFLWHSQRDDKCALKLLNRTTSKLAIPVGLAANRKFIWFDPFDSDSPHVLVGGTTGAGKSVTMNSWLCTLIGRNTPYELQLALIDLKMVELTPYENIPHLFRPVVKRPEGVSLLLDELWEELERRLNLFAGAGVRSLNEYNEKRPERAEPYLFLFFDEIALVMLDKGLSSKAEPLLARLAALGRAVGIAMMMFTQRPSVDVVSGIIKTNVTNRLAFNTDEQGSKTILGNGMAKGLNPRGRGIWYSRGEYFSLQAPLIYPEQINRAIHFATHHAAPPPPLTTERLLALAIDERGNYEGGRVNFLKLVQTRYPSTSMAMFNALFWQVHYRPAQAGPVHLSPEGKRFIIWGATVMLLPDGAKLPTSEDEIFALQLQKTEEQELNELFNE